jgi:heme/copper-type cytochrome/quinol oxidase subunit 3
MVLVFIWPQVSWLSFFGTIALFVSFIRSIINHFTDKHHFGFESAIWYWHFVDVVWLFFIHKYIGGSR